ncbi:hypothetical protein M9H77_20780 [Catharanthus roseus]|uniref:Uncharacterized protein n=1 Tax=Catharanthus roseus TaxID=4058 RepID=A0ACC0AN73_CATRO|nr:hypothetical protein M9H77_20780 [Catharanthus roseus]
MYEEKENTEEKFNREELRLPVLSTSTFSDLHLCHPSKKLHLLCLVRPGNIDQWSLLLTEDIEDAARKEIKFFLPSLHTTFPLALSSGFFFFTWANPNNISSSARNSRSKRMWSERKENKNEKKVLNDSKQSKCGWVIL